MNVLTGVKAVDTRFLDVGPVERMVMGNMSDRSIWVRILAPGQEEYAERWVQVEGFPYMRIEDFRRWVTDQVGNDTQAAANVDRWEREMKELMNG